LLLLHAWYAGDDDCAELMSSIRSVSRQHPTSLNLLACAPMLLVGLWFLHSAPLRSPPSWHRRTLISMDRSGVAPQEQDGPILPFGRKARIQHSPLWNGSRTKATEANACQPTLVTATPLRMSSNEPLSTQSSTNTRHGMVLETRTNERPFVYGCAGDATSSLK
jgi:hypothetical protein